MDLYPEDKTGVLAGQICCQSEAGAAKHAQLEMAGWRVIVIWECETRDEDVLRFRLARLFGLDEQAV